MKKELFGNLPDGRGVFAYTLENSKITAKILNLGGIINRLVVDGTDVVGGFDTVEGILEDTSYQGSLIGRYGNRIKNAAFTINGTTYKLYANSAPCHHLHGGKSGFNRKIWEVTDAAQDRLVLEYFSEDGEEGYPGNLKVKVTYTLNSDSLEIRYEAVSDKDTYCNLTNHAYYNLNGVGCGEITDHTLKIFADEVTEVDGELIPTGKRIKVKGTPYDFTAAKKVGRDLTGKNRNEPFFGYDHNFVLTGKEKAEYKGKMLNLCAVLSAGNKEMTVLTTMPCVQLYTGNYMGADNPFKGGVKQFARMALCLETQYEPDSPTRGENLLKAGEKYDHTTVMIFK